MVDILSQIVANKKKEVERLKEAVPASLLLERIETMTYVPHSMKQALAASPTGIIAEFKRRSPSKGWIHRDAEVTLIPPAYEKAGAAALSILADHDYFGGSITDLQQVRPLVSIPVLCKEFIIDEYQLMQARLAGADAVLLIAACLSREQCMALAACAHRLQLEVLLEVHAADELPYTDCGADMVGINNRHLGSFHTDVENSFRLAGQLQEAVARLKGTAPLLVSESGLSQADMVRRLRKAGFRGFLMGETFMRTARPADTLAAFIREMLNPDGDETVG